jgi:serine/threonine protein phosphatase PrpC
MRSENSNVADPPSPPQVSMLDVEFAEITDTGRVRDHNEDYLDHVVPQTPAQAHTIGCLFALADGVGGQDLGEVASRTAIETVVAGFRSAPGGESHAALLPRLLQLANTRVYEAGMAARPGGVAMATTMVACALRFDRAVVAHVGDSRCYLIRHGHWTALTRDHTVTNEQVRLGLISTSEAAQAESRHVLSRSLGNDLFVNVDSSEHQIHAGDILVLCSDGLHGSIPPSEISHLAAQDSDLNRVGRKLVALANERDGRDNISIQLIRVRSVERVGMYRGRPYKLR